MLLDPPTETSPTESPGLFTRFGEEVANIVPETGTDLQDLLFSAGFKTPGEEKPKPISNIFDVPPAKTIPEAATDIAAGITKAIPFFVAGETAGEGVAKVASLGPRMTKVIRTAAGFGLQGATESPKQGAEDATLGAAFGATEGLPLRAKLIAAPLIGLATGAEAYNKTNNTTAAIVQGVVNAAIPFALKGRRVEDVDSAPARSLIEPPKQSVTGSTETPILFKSAEESAAVMTGEIPPMPDAPASSAIQKEQLRQHYESLDAAKTEPSTEIATLQKTPLASPVVVDGQTLAFKEDVDAALSKSLASRKEEAAQATRDLTINPSRQLKLSTVLHPNDSEMIQKAANKYDLEFTGVHGDGKQLLFTNPEADTPTTFSVPVGATLKDLKNRMAEVESFPKEPVATLQKVAEPPLTENIPPSSLESPAKTSGTFETGAKVLHDFGDGPELSIVKKSEDGTNVIQSAITGEFREGVADQKLTPVGASRIADAFSNDKRGRDLIESVGNLAEVEKENAAKVGRGMKRPTPDQGGFITPELALALGRYVATPISTGIVTGALSDDDHRMQNTLLGLVGGLALGHFAPRVIASIRKGFPDVGKDGKPNTLVKAVKQLTVETKEDVQNISAARAATKADGTVTAWDRLARWSQKNWGSNLDETRISDLAKGQVNDLASIMEQAIKPLTRAAVSPDARKAIGDYIAGNFKGDTEAFIKAVGNRETAQSAILARSANDAAQQIIIDSLPAGKLKTQIEESKGKYLTTVYKIFHEKWTPSQDKIEAAARALEGPYGSMEERRGVIQQYLHEAEATRDLFSKGLFKHGEALGSILTRKEDLSPEFKALLGEYDDPIEKLAVTGMKLVNGARTAALINEAISGTKTNGLKFAYQSEELSLLKENIVSRLASTKDLKEIATLQNQLSDLRKYVFQPENANHGKLGNKWVDIHLHDDLATYDSVVSTSATRVGEFIRQTNNLFRYGHVALNPLQYARQVLNAPLLGMMSKTTPVDWYKAAQTLWAGGEDVARLKRLNIIGADYIQGQFRQDMNEFVKGTLDKYIYSNVIGKGLRQWENIFRGPDLTIRVAAFQRKEAQFLREGMSAAEAERKAIDYTNRYTMNYSAVPPGLLKARQYPFVNQFLTFAYESARIAYNLAEDAVGRGPEKRIDFGAAAILTSLATTPFILQGVSEYGMSSEDKQNWDRIKNLGPTYAKGNFRFFLNKDNNGNMHYIDFTPLIIHDSWTKMFRDAIHGDASAFAADNPMFGWENTPLLNVAAKQVSGQDYHTGQALNSFGARVNSIRRDLAPSIFGAELDRWAEALTPNVEGGLGITSARTGRNISVGGIMFSYLTSIRAYTSNPAYMVQRAILSKQKEINDSAMEYRRVAMSNAADSIKQAAYTRFYNQQQNIYRKLQEELQINSQ